MPRWRYLWLVALLGAGCGGKGIDGTPFQRTDSGIPDIQAQDLSRNDTRSDGSGADSGTGADRGDAGTADSASTGVVVVVSIDQPGQDDIVPAAQRFVPQVTVTVTVPSGTASDNLDTVVAELWSTGANAKKISTTPLTLTSRIGTVGNDTSYAYAETPVDVSGLASGAYELRLTATTLGGAKGTATRGIRTDSGPTIVITKPVAGSAYKGSIAAQVTITDAIFAPISDVKMSVGNHDLTPSGPTGNPANQWTTLIDFNAYMPALDGEQLFAVTASNSNGTRTSATVRLVIDNQGPTITDTLPAVGTIIGSLITISATITDPAHVLDASVVAVVAHGSESFTVKLDPDSSSPGRYSHQFDTRLLDVHDLYPTVSFRASDLLGNESSIGYTVALDNTAPLADLDPPPHLRMREKSGGDWLCSWEFDPLGSDAVGDGEKVAQLFDVRARVEDRGNSPFSGGADVIPVSLVDPARVELLVLSDTSQPLVVDSDNDGICDKINPLLVPTTTPMSSKDALLINLVPVPPSGQADMTHDPSIAADATLPCGPGTATEPPDALCFTTDLSIAIPYTFAKEPAIWAPAPVIPTGLQCVGNQFDDYANNIRDGWACMAVRAADKLGNEQVSRVLRVCIDHDGIGNECPHQRIVAVSNATPIAVTTTAPHGLVSGDDIVISRSDVLAAQGRWLVTVSGPNSFTLDGSQQDNQHPGNGVSGIYVKSSVLPDCTGAQTSIQPVTVNPTPRCTPWSAYPAREVRTIF
ncbi:MAG TPA: hypothetical protein VFH68_11250 [Polyangia bacterium]|nr:hypothetical protein [Polyangia bacterium]